MKKVVQVQDLCSDQTDIKKSDKPTPLNLPS